MPYSLQKLLNALDVYSSPLSLWSFWSFIPVWFSANALYSLTLSKTCDLCVRKYTNVFCVKSSMKVMKYFAPPCVWIFIGPFTSNWTNFKVWVVLELPLWISVLFAIHTSLENSNVEFLSKSKSLTRLLSLNFFKLAISRRPNRWCQRSAFLWHLNAIPLKNQLIGGTCHSGPQGAGSRLRLVRRWPVVTRDGKN